MQAGKGLQACGLKVLGHLTLECVGKVVCDIEYNIFGWDGGIHEVFMFVENHGGYFCYTCQLDPQVPARMVHKGCAEPIGFDAVFGKGFASVGFFVDGGFHANGDEW